MKRSLFTLALLAACCSLGSWRAQAQTTLFSESFDTDTSASWDVFGGSANSVPDYTVLFGFDYSTNRFVRNGVTNTIPPAPNGGGKGVKMWVNKNDSTLSTAAVSIYPKGKTFSGQYALKFDMWLNYNGGAGGGSGSTEFATFGINHVGDKVNWADVASPSDGVWFAVTGESGAAYDYRAYYGDAISPPYRAEGSAAFLDRNGDALYEDEVIGTEAADYPLFTLFPSPEFETEGMPSKRWVEVEIRQRTNDTGTYTVTWLINNYVIAEHSSADALGVNRGNIMLGNMDIFASIADPKEDNYVIYDNVRVIDLNSTPRVPVVTLTTNDATASEPADTASVTVTRFGSSSAPLTVNYRVTGTAQAGSDFATLGGAVLLAAGQDSTNIVVTPVNDALGEAVETISITLVGSTNYDVYTNMSATLLLQDDADVPIASISATKTNAYEGNALNDARFTVNLSNPSSTATTIGFAVSGTAVGGTDYTAFPNSVTIPAGETNATVRITPINNNTTQTTARTVTLTINSGTGYVLGTATNATVNIRDDDLLPAGTLVYSENFEQDPAGSWVVNASGGEHPVDLSFDYSTVGIPAAPGSTAGATRGAKLQANISGGIFGGVSISPAALNLTNDYALRFNLWQNFNGPAPDGGPGSTQISGGGIGTPGTNPLWPGGTQTGIWFASTGDGNSTIDYRAYSSAAPTGHTETSVFAAGGRDNANPYYYEFGRNQPPAEQTASFPSQAGTTLAGAQGFVWRDVVIMKRGTQVTWYIDGKLLATINANATNFTGGNIALLHSDINAGSSADPNAPTLAFGLFDNVRAYQLSAAQPTSQPRITGIRMVNNGAGVQIDFDADAQDVIGNFTLQASATVNGTFTDATGATITQLSPGKFRATINASGNQQFYRLRR